MSIENLRDFTRIVIVDDIFSEGEAMRKALLGKDIGSTFYHINSEGDFPSSPLKNVRVVFLDFILSPLAVGITGAGPQAKHALGNLRRFVDNDSLYILIIWSSHATRSAVSRFKSEIIDSPYIADPVKIITLSKSKYNAVGENSKPRLSAIQNVVQKELLLCPAFSIFSEGERLAMNAVSKSTAEVIKGKNDSDIAKTILSLSHTYDPNPKFKKNIPNNALLLFSKILEDSISKEIVDYNFKILYQKLGTDELLPEDVVKLNGSLIFSPNNVAGSGALYFPKYTVKQKESLISDSINTTKEQLIIEDVNFYNKLVPFILDMTPLCGDAQNNGYKYFVKGLIHPERFKSTGEEKGEIKFHKEIVHTLRNNFEYKDVISQISICLKTCCTDKSLIEKLEAEMKLRPDITVAIQQKVASYISRPGHILL